MKKTPVGGVVYGDALWGLAASHVSLSFTRPKSARIIRPPGRRGKSFQFFEPETICLLRFTRKRALHAWHARGILILFVPVDSEAMRLKLYCNRYGHFKDALVCSVNCVYRTRCNDFALFYDERRAEVDALVSEYYDARRAQGEQKPRPAADTTTTTAHIPPVARPEELRKLIRLEVLREMAESVYIWIDKEDRAELLETGEVIRRAERGQKAKHIYRVAQEMELRYQLVPRKRIDKAKRVAAVEAERAEARRTRKRDTSRPAPNAPVPFPAPVAEAERETPAPRRARARAGR